MCACFEKPQINVDILMNSDRQMVLWHQNIRHTRTHGHIHAKPKQRQNEKREKVIETIMQPTAIHCAWDLHWQNLSVEQNSSESSCKIFYRLLLPTCPSCCVEFCGGSAKLIEKKYRKSLNQSELKQKL